MTSEHRRRHVRGSRKDRHPSTPPAPKQDVIECWLPTEEQLMHGGPPCLNVPRDGQLSSLKALLNQHREELANHLDDRLATHIQEILQRLTCGTSLAEDVAKRAAEGTVSAVLQRLFSEESGVADLATCSANLSEAPAGSALTASKPGTEVLLSGPCRDRAEPGLQQAKKIGSSMGHEISAVSFDDAERAKIEKARSSNGKKSKSQMRGKTSPLRVFVESGILEAIMCVVVVVHVAFVGLEVGATYDVTEDDEVPFFWTLAEYVFIGLFSVEILLKLLVQRPLVMAFCCNRWNIFDVVMVAASVITILLPGLGYLLLFRLTRVLRIVRIIRVVKVLRPLRILAYSILNTLRMLGWMLLLVALMVYVFAVAFVTASSSISPEDQDLKARTEAYFSSVPLAMQSLFKAVTGGLDWAYLADSLGEVGVIWSLIFFAYVALFDLVVFNVVTGVACQITIETAKHPDIEVHAQQMQKQLYLNYCQKLYSLLVDETGQITLGTFEDQLRNGALKHFFEVILEVSVDEAWNFFKLVEGRDEDGKISFEEFSSGCQKLKGGARSYDLHTLLYQSRWIMDRLATLQQGLDVLGSHMNRLQKGVPTTNSLRKMLVG